MNNTSANMCLFLCVCFWQTPEKRSHNGYTNLPDVVQPSHSPTDSASHSSPGKDSAYDVSFAHLTFKSFILSTICNCIMFSYVE